MAVYTYTKEDETDYQFRTDSGVIYWVRFNPETTALIDFCSGCVGMYEVSFFPYGSKPDKEDPNIMETVLQISRDFFQNDHCHALYFDFLNDSQIAARARKIIRKINGTLEKDAYHFECNSMMLKDQVCAIIKTDSMHFEEIKDSIRLYCHACPGPIPETCEPEETGLECQINVCGQINEGDIESIANCIHSVAGFVSISPSNIMLWNEEALMSIRLISVAGPIPIEKICNEIECSMGYSTSIGYVC